MTVDSSRRSLGRRSRSTASIFAPRYRITTLAIVTLMTIIAFEALAVATALPTAARSLHGLASYGWAFTGFLVASVVGMVASGMHADTRGPRSPLLVGLVLFISGLLVGGVAESMWVLVAARVVQGLAVGLLITAMYVVMGEVYDDAIRPKMFAALATSWIVPGLVGPVVAGWITEHLSWRWVFGGLAPFVAIAGVCVRSCRPCARSAPPPPPRGAPPPPGAPRPALRQLRTHTASGAVRDRRRIGFAVLTALGIAGVADLGESRSVLSVLLGILGLAAMVFGLRRLLPAGTAGFVVGVPAAIAFRGVLAGVFSGMEIIVPLTLTVQHHYSPTLAGMPLMLTAISWATASQIQGRLRDPNRAVLMALGLTLIAAGGFGMAVVAVRTVPGWTAFLCWPVAGFGAGFALTSASVVLLEHTTDADRGSDSAAFQLSDSAMSALFTGFSGALVASAAHGRISYGAGFATVYLTMAIVAVLTILRAPRLRPKAVPDGVGPLGAPRVVSS